jgi:murein L,D-transpeptidase YafK
MKKLLLFLLPLCIIAVYYFFPEQKLPDDVKVDRIVILKGERVMQLYANDKIVKTYKISLGGNPIGDKESEGDKRTPEGKYVINAKNDKSGYHKNLGISYPDKIDIEEAKRKNVKPGGNIKIHGLRNGIGFIGKFQRWVDWTAGCVALTNSEMDELYNAVEIGTPIIILP